MSPFQMGSGGPKEGHTWTWIRHCSVSPCTQDLQAARLYPSSSLPALTPCSCPLQVSHPGRVPVLEVSLSTSPAFGRNPDQRLRGALHSRVPYPQFIAESFPAVQEHHRCMLADTFVCLLRCLRLRCATEGPRRPHMDSDLTIDQSHLARRTCGPHDSTHLRVCPL
jgi:hypothetical protein